MTRLRAPRPRVVCRAAAGLYLVAVLVAVLWGSGAQIAAFKESAGPWFLDAAGKDVAHDIAMHVAAYMPAYLDRDSVPADVLEKERATLEKITLEEGKPANIVPKIVEGRLNAFYKDNCLVDQAFARDPSKSVAQVLKEAGATVTNFVRVHVGA